MPKPIFVEKVNAKAREELTSLAKTPNKGLDKRAKIILLSNKGYTVSEISKNIGIHYQNVRKWIYRFSESGVTGLYHGNKGRKNKLRYGEELQKQIAETAVLNPTELGLTFTNWTLEKLKDYLVHKKTVEPDIAIETIRNILIANGKYWGKDRRTPHNLLTVGVIIHFDKKGKVSVEECKNSTSNNKNGKALIEQEVTTKEPTALFASYAPLTNKLVVKVYNKE